MAKMLSDLLLEYQLFSNNREFSNLRSILKRRIFPDLLKLDGLQQLQGKKLDYMLEHMPLAGFVALANPIFQSQILQLARSNTLKVEKSQWKRFCTWLQAHEQYVPDPAPLVSVSEAVQPAYSHIPKGTLKAVMALKKKREKTKGPIALLERDWTADLITDRQSFDFFLQTVTRWRRKAVTIATLKQCHRSIARVLGYKTREQGIALEALAITDLLDQTLLQAYVESSQKRGLSSNTIKSDMAVVIPIAQWQFHLSTPNENYSNPEPVKAIRSYLKTILIDHRDRPRVSDEACAERELTRQQCWEILDYLSWRCKDLEKQHGMTRQVIDAWMDYLMIAFLVTTGARQRELRELQRQYLALEGNVIFVKLPPEGHKNGNKTGRGREYPLFVGPMQLSLTTDLQYYLEHIRPQNLDHDFLFFLRLNQARPYGRIRRGDPIRADSYLSNLVSKLIACVTAHLYGIEQAKWTTPHDFRRIIATWVCTYGEPKHLPIFAELLGHSMDMLVKIYNKRHPGDLARQSPFAYDEIAAREERMQDSKDLGRAKAATSMSEMSLSALVAMLQKLVRKLWYALTQRKQNEVLASLSPVEREAIDA
ncbi:MAG: tyrosine-type recombinase/integrase [Stenomitos rutilans HA7619-LM2]|jgi:integrase|nr:tyrosine-type recombinase/integrase [Stenomitos rutilans HA7619-LM2]